MKLTSLKGQTALAAALMTLAVAGAAQAEVPSWCGLLISTQM